MQLGYYVIRFNRYRRPGASIALIDTPGALRGALPWLGPTAVGNWMLTRA
jgi:hypothetical protein